MEYDFKPGNMEHDFKPGDIVIHEIRGIGRIIQITDNKICVKIYPNSGGSACINPEKTYTATCLKNFMRKMPDREAFVWIAKNGILK